MKLFPRAGNPTITTHILVSSTWTPRPLVLGAMVASCVPERLLELQVQVTKSCEAIGAVVGCNYGTKPEQQNIEASRVRNRKGGGRSEASLGCG